MSGRHCRSAPPTYRIRLQNSSDSVLSSLGKREFVMILQAHLNSNAARARTHSEEQGSRGGSTDPCDLSGGQQQPRGGGARDRSGPLIVLPKSHGESRLEGRGALWTVRELKRKGNQLLFSRTSEGVERARRVIRMVTADSKARTEELRHLSCVAQRPRTPALAITIS